MNRKLHKAAAIGGAALFASFAWSAARRALAPSFRDQVVVITGGSRGLGLELARMWGSEGARIAICARTASDLGRAQADLSARGITALAIPCDVMQEQQAKDFIHQILHHWGRIDVLVNNAGIIQVGPMECMTVEDFRQAMDCHFWGPFNTMLATIHSMRACGQGRIVNVCSIGGRISVPHLLPYCASKFALAGLSEGLHAELAQHGIAVTTVYPGLMRTGSPRNAQFKGQNRLEYAWFSVSDAQPGLTIGSRRAARLIVEACRRGDAEIVLSGPAKVAVRLRALFPALSAALLRTANRLLPSPGGIGTRTATGRESFSTWSPSSLTTLDDRAAERNNELSHGP